ncbi:hypothetical protein ACFX13_028052 [Malus domestica]
MMFLVFSQSSVVVLVECRGLLGSDGRRGADVGQTTRPSFSSFAGKMRDKVFVGYQKMSTLASGPSRRGSGH